MNPMIPGLAEAKMSSSKKNSKIDLLDNAAPIKKKLKKAFCEPGNITDNGLLSFSKSVIFPLSKDGEKYFVPRSADFRGDISFQNYEDLENAFAKQEIYPSHLKCAVELYINRLLDPIRKEFTSDGKLKSPSSKAHQSPPKQKQQPVTDEVAPSRLDIRIGKIVDVRRHSDANSTYVEKIDLGEESGLRTIVSGLVNYVPIEEMKDRMLVVLVNFKKANLRGEPFHGMVLCASVDEPTKQWNLRPPTNNKPVDIVVVEGYESSIPDKVLNPKKKRQLHRCESEVNV